MTRSPGIPSATTSPEDEMVARTVQPDEHQSLPELGVLVGHLADALRIKGDLLDLPTVNGRTVRRWFAGERIDHEARGRIFDAFFEAWLPADYGGAEAPILSLLRPTIEAFADRWDSEVAAMLTYSVPAARAELAALPLARLFMLDFAIRYGAVRKSLGGAGVATLPEHPLSPTLFADHLREIQARYGLQTVEALAEAAGVDHTTAQRWRARDLPSAESFDKLLRGLARAGAPVGARVGLRLTLAVTEVVTRLEALYGEFFTELVAGFHEVADHIHGAVRKAGLPTDHLVRLALEGSRSRVGASMARDLAERTQAMRPRYSELQLDFVALPGAWAERALHWAKSLHVPDDTLQMLVAESARLGMGNGEDREGLFRAIAHALPRVQWRIRGFLEPIPTFGQAIHMKLPPKLAAMNWCEQANEAKSAGDLDTALEFARTAIERDPELGYAHFLVGAILGQKLRSDPWMRTDDGVIRHAATECRVAWQLDPSLPIALNEVGIILTNAGKYEEAEEAYDEAAGPCEGLEHHHFCRARNFLALGELEKATSSFEATLRLRPDHLHAMAHLAVLYAQGGRKRDSNTLADRVHQRVGVDPRMHAVDWLDPFYVRHLYVPRTGFGPNYFG